MQPVPYSSVHHRAVPRLLAAAPGVGKPIPGREGIHVQTAATDTHRQQAELLIRRMYGWRGYHRAPGTTVAAPGPGQTVLRALRGEETVGTITLGLDTPAGLLVDGLYAQEVARLRGHGRRLCELTGLAVAPGGHSRQVLAALFQGAYLLGRKQHRATDLVIEVNPRHVAYYRSGLGFREAGPLRLCPRVGAPAVLLHLDLEQVEATLAAAA